MLEELRKFLESAAPLPKSPECEFLVHKMNVFNNWAGAPRASSLECDVSLLKNCDGSHIYIVVSVPDRAVGSDRCRVFGEGGGGYRCVGRVGCVRQWELACCLQD